MSTGEPAIWARVESELRSNWGKGKCNLQAPTEPCCLVGAVGRAYGHQWITDAYDATESLGFAETVDRLFPDRFTGRAREFGSERVIDFNDHPDTVLDDVLLVVAETRDAHVQ